MRCEKSFALAIGNCTGLTTDAVWVYNPAGSPNQPPAGLVLTDSFVGYGGTWEASKSGADLATTGVAEWRVDWTSVFGKTLRVRSTIVGSVTRGGSAANVICRSNANGNVVTQTQFCPANQTTLVNLEATATDATLGGATAASCNHQAFFFDGTYSLSGIVVVECV